MREALKHFGITPLQVLGGRVNQHWLVSRGKSQFVLRRWFVPPESVEYEVRLMGRLARMGWPIPEVVEGPVDIGSGLWSLSPYLEGQPQPMTGPEEQRSRGRLLAEFHQVLVELHDIGQRNPWRRCEEILSDLSLDTLFAAHEARKPEEARDLLSYLDLARARLASVPASDLPGQVIHGDFTNWNLRFIDGKLSAILDFEFAHWDHRVADFALAWRGKYDEVINGYQEVAPLSEAEMALLAPCWWANLLDTAADLLRRGARDDGWIAKKLAERSPLLGLD